MIHYCLTIEELKGTIQLQNSSICLQGKVLPGMATVLDPLSVCFISQTEKTSKKKHTGNIELCRKKPA